MVWLTFQWPLSLFRSESLLVLLVTPLAPPTRERVGMISASPHARAWNRSVLLCSGRFCLALVQWFRLQPAFLGRPLVGRVRVLHVRGGLRRTVLVGAGCSLLAASIRVLVLHRSGRSFFCWVRGPIGLNRVGFYWICWFGWSAVSWVANSTWKGRRP